MLNVFVVKRYDVCNLLLSDSVKKKKMVPIYGKKKRTLQMIGLVKPKYSAMLKYSESKM